MAGCVLASVSVRALPVILAGLALIAPRVAVGDALGFDPEGVYQAPIDDAPRRGPADAPVTIVVWSDFSCRYCNRVEPTLEQVDRLYPGRLRWVFRHLPLDDENIITAEASLAAAAQGRFWPMKDRLFAVRGRIDRAGVELIAGELGIDLVRFRADLDAGTHRAKIRADVKAARALGITGTPTFFINGRPVRGSQPLRLFADVIDQELVRAADATRAGIAGADLYAHLVGSGHRTADAPLTPATTAKHELDPTALYAVGLGLPGHQIGPDDALVTIAVWSDFECGFCARNVPDLDRLRREHPTDVRIVFRHMPLRSHPRAQLAAEAAVAAGAQGKFWPFHDRIFAHQDQLDRAGLEAAAKQVGLDLAAFRAALDDRRYHEVVAAEAAAGSVLGVSGTPAMFINGAPVEGAVGYDTLSAMVDAHRQVAGGLVARGIERRDVYGMVMLSPEARDRADPSRIPRPGEVVLELAPVEREAAAIAACRGRDAARALGFAAKLTGAKRAVVDTTCASIGIDLAR
jgi:protein-disulfide isomerase